MFSFIFVIPDLGGIILLLIFILHNLSYDIDDSLLHPMELLRLSDYIYYLRGRDFLTFELQNHLQKGGSPQDRVPSM